MQAFPFRVRFWGQWFIITELCARLAWRDEFELREDFHLCGEKAAQLTQVLRKLC